MAPDSVISKIKKILALVERGATDGERAAAQKQLDRLLGEYDLTLEDIASHEIKAYKFVCQDKEEFEMLIQIICRVCRVSSVDWWRYPENKKGRIFKMTAVQHADVVEMYRFYKRELAEELKRVMMAFYNRHDLFNPDGEGSDEPMDPAELKRLIELMRAMRSKTFIKVAGHIE